MSVLKIAVAGAGLIGRVHIKTIEASSVCELVAIVDPGALAVDLAAEKQVPLYSSLDELFAAHRPDGVILATPNPLHVAQAQCCLYAGVPSLLEKPVATTFAEGAVLLEDIRCSGVPLLVGHHRAHSEIMTRACEIVASGKLGRLVSVIGSAQFYKPDAYFEQAPWRTQPGGGPILINLIHEVHNLRMLMGEISEVQAIASNDIRQFDVEDTVSLNLRFVSGALGCFMLSDTAACTHSWEQTSGENPAYSRYEGEDCYQVSGTRGALSMPSMRVYQHAQNQESSWWEPMIKTVDAVTRVDPLERQLAHFIQVIRGECQPLVSVKDGLENLKVVEAIMQAARSGCAIALKQGE